MMGFGEKKVKGRCKAVCSVVPVGKVKGVGKVRGR
jgi:hypothetical protein